MSRKRKRRAHYDPWDSRPSEPSHEDDPFGGGGSPTIDAMPRKVDYSTRGPRDFVVSGPLPGANGPGRFFPSKGAALNWARKKYGEHRVSMVDTPDNSTRWAILVKYQSPEQAKLDRLRRLRERAAALRAAKPPAD